jgi:hypothetical protein
MDLIMTTSQPALCSILTKVTELKLQEFDGEDIVLASGWIRGVVAVLKNVNIILPLDCMIIVFNILKTASDIPFVNQVTSLESLVTNKVLVANFHDVLTKSEAFYQVRKTLGDWTKSKHNIKGSIFAVAQEHVVCYGCGKKGHYKSTCPDDATAASTEGKRTGSDFDLTRRPGRGEGKERIFKGTKIFWCGRCNFWTDHLVGDCTKTPKTSHAPATAALAVAAEAASSTHDNTPPENAPAAGLASSIDPSSLEFHGLGV